MNMSTDMPDGLGDYWSENHAGFIASLAIRCTEDGRTAYVR